MLNIVKKISKTLILTDYGRKRVLENITETGEAAGYNLTHICFGNKLNTIYDTSITSVGHIIAEVPITTDNMKIDGNKYTITVDLDYDKNIYEIGIYETVGSFRHLFAYIGGIELKDATNKISYKLILSLVLELEFQDFDYPTYNVEMKEPEYGMHEEVDSLYSDLFNTQLNLERCIQINARKIGFNRPEVYYEQQKEISNDFENSLMINTYGKVVNNFRDGNLVDYFIYPKYDKDNYNIRNLRDLESFMKISKNVQSANKDNVDFTRKTSLVYVGTISSLSKTGTILAKADPKTDNAYFTFEISSDDVKDESAEKYLKFTAYSYDMDLYQKLTVDNGEEYEPKIVGEYSIKYRITKDLEMLNNVLNKNCTFTFVFNSDEENPKFLFYINDTCINDRVLTSGKAGNTSFNPDGLDIGDESYDGELLIRCIPYNSAYKPRKSIVYNVGDKFNLKGHSFEVISIIESVVVISNDNYSKPPSFEDYKDHVRYDIISTLDPDVDVLRLTAKLPTHEVGIQDIVVYDEDDVEIDTYDLEELKLLGIFDDLIRDNVHISNYNATSGNFTRDEVQTADSVADADFLRQYKIIGDITWRNYKLRYDYYQSMQKNCTLKNYSMYLETKETKDGVPFVNEVYYTLDTVTPTTVMTFSKELTLDDIKFIAQVNRG